jgi:hypothetical protein
VQTVHRDEFLEVERRTEVVHAAIHMIEVFNAPGSLPLQKSAQSRLLDVAPAPKMPDLERAIVYHTFLSSSGESGD